MKHVDILTLQSQEEIKLWKYQAEMCVTYKQVLSISCKESIYVTLINLRFALKADSSQIPWDFLGETPAVMGSIMQSTQALASDMMLLPATGETSHSIYSDKINRGLWGSHNLAPSILYCIRFM